MQIRQQLTKRLWENYKKTSSQAALIEASMMQKGEQHLTLDHFAIIDLPSKQSGISFLTDIFTALGYVARGQDYLPSKQNAFLWLSAPENFTLPATQSLSQVVVADFRLDELPLEVKVIIEKYASKTKAPPLKETKQLIERITSGDHAAQEKLETLLLNYFSGRDWPLPTVKEFLTVQDFNELLAWVLIFGRRPNHFTFSIHLLESFPDFPSFLTFIENELNLPLNNEGGKVKGSEVSGLAQASTQGLLHTLTLTDGPISLPSDFVEFVWRYPHSSQKTKPHLWNDYFTGFIASHADYVIESLYT